MTATTVATRICISLHPGLMRGLRQIQLLPVFPVGVFPLRYIHADSIQGVQEMKKLYMLSHVLSLITVIGPGQVSSEVMYKWLDADGKVHFSDRAPPGNQSETTVIRSSSGKGKPGNSPGLRPAERELLGLSRQREHEIRQARRRSVSKHAAGKSRCRAARNRYDDAKRKPGAASSALVKRYFEEMRTLCR